MFLPVISPRWRGFAQKSRCDPRAACKSGCDAGPVSGASSTIRGWVGQIIQKFCSKSAASKSLICPVILCIHSLSTTGFLHPRTHPRDGDDSPEIWRNCRRRRSSRQFAPAFLGKALPAPENTVPDKSVVSAADAVRGQCTARLGETFASLAPKWFFTRQ